MEQYGWRHLCTAYSKFRESFSYHYNKYIPKVEYKFRIEKYKPWISACLLKSIKHKHELYIQSLNGDIDKRIYTVYKNKLNHLLRISKRRYYIDLMEQNKNNLAKSWKIIKQIINKRKNNATSNSQFIHDGKLIENSHDIANSFNDFFINVGPTLAQKIPQTNKNAREYLPVPMLKSLFLSPVTEQEVMSLITMLKHTSPGWDEVDSRVIKEVAIEISEPLTYIIDRSIITGQIPSELKLAKVTPIFKAGDAKIFSNYRPVSVLPIFSKLLERAIYKRLITFLNENKILYDYQFDFREAYSTELALTLFLDKVTNALENKEFVIGIFLDLSKAFDTINLKILLKKLESYGIRGIALTWFRNYISNRSQYVIYNGKCSAHQTLKCGVPQGSILGPLLFLLYINDLHLVSDKLFSLLFADDTTFLITGKNPNQVNDILNNEMGKISQWFKVNQLSVNFKKN